MASKTAKKFHASIYIRIIFDCGNKYRVCRVLDFITSWAMSLFLNLIKFVLSKTTNDIQDQCPSHILHLYWAWTCATLDATTTGETRIGRIVKEFIRQVFELESGGGYFLRQIFCDLDGVSDGAEHKQLDWNEINTGCRHLLRPPWVDTVEM